MSRTHKSIVFVVSAAIVICLILSAVIIMSGKRESTAVTVGIVLTGSTQEPGWNTAHYSGLSAACEKIGAQLLVKENILENTGVCPKAAQELIDEGAQAIFLASTGYGDELTEVIEKNPDVAFLGIFITDREIEMTQYLARMYQARYLSGIVAGLTTDTNIAGYVAAERNPEVIRGINAFALGMRSVNPDAQVNVIFTGAWDNMDNEYAAAHTLVTEGRADIITYHQNLPYAAEAADRLGAYSIGYHTAVHSLSEKHLTSAVWDWEKIYTPMLEDYMRGSTDSQKLYWSGIENGGVSLAPYSAAVSEETIAAVEQAKQELISGNYIFSGTIIDNEGNIRCGENENIGDEHLYSHMDWFVEGVSIYE